MPGALALNSARLRYFGLSIYDGRLYVQPGFSASSYAEHVFALELSYLRALRGKLIAERSIEEMQRAGALPEANRARWLAAMVEAFPNVQAGDRITGMHQPGMGARFWFNGELRATIADPEFSRRFFGIWLAQSTSEPALRDTMLRGQPP